jgi:hypothetical protein
MELRNDKILERVYKRNSIRSTSLDSFPYFWNYVLVFVIGVDITTASGS